MNTDEGFIYLVGLIVLAVSIGNYVDSVSIGFMVLGGGIVIAPVLSMILRYLNH